MTLILGDPIDGHYVGGTHSYVGPSCNGHLLQYFVAEDTTDAPSQAFMACT